MEILFDLRMEFGVRYFREQFPFSRVPLQLHKESHQGKTRELPSAYVTDSTVQNGELRQAWGHEGISSIFSFYAYLSRPLYYMRTVMALWVKDSNLYLWDHEGQGQKRAQLWEDTLILISDSHARRKRQNTCLGRL